MPAVKRRLLKYKKLILLLSGLIAVCFILLTIIKLVAPINGMLKQNNLSPSFIISYFLKKDDLLKKINNRTNLVVLGISGGNRDGFDLTDSIIFMSIDFDKKDTLMVSIPRDVWLPSLKTKINSAYHYGEKKKEGGGLILAKASVNEVLGQSTSYAVVLDFDSFKSVIDLVGGINVTVEKSFEDKLYPIAGKENDFCGGDQEFKCRYETVRFEKGVNQMNGETALKYVRSRFAEDEEGTDFSRGKRQRQVLMATLSKIKSLLSLNNLPLLSELMKLMDTSVETDMNLSELFVLGNYFLRESNQNFRQISLDSGNKVQGREGLLINPPLWQYDGIWVLIPKNEDYSQIYDYIACSLEKDDCSF